MDEYLKFRNDIKSKALNKKLDQYSSRLNEVKYSESIQKGIWANSVVATVAQKTLNNYGVKNVWLVPAETSIQEYSENDFLVYNPYTKKRYSLFQSPQIQKECAAVLVGSNYRLATCFRGEKCDYIHSQIFQQFDVEFCDTEVSQVKKIAEELVSNCVKEVRKDCSCVFEYYEYKDLMELYGEDNPNLYYGLWIEKIEEHYGISLYGVDEIDLCKSKVSNNLDYRIESIHGVDYIFNVNNTISELRAFRDSLIKDGIMTDRKDKLVLYWVDQMPFVYKNKEEIKLVHHVMSMPSKAANNSSFRFTDLTEQELLDLTCNSYDLLMCNDNGVVEIIGGDERISSFALQYDAIKAVKEEPEKYAFLLEMLHFNDQLPKPHRLSGFALGTDRLSQELLGLYDMKYVQLFPTNYEDGELIHAISKEDI